MGELQATHRVDSWLGRASPSEPIRTTGDLAARFMEATSVGGAPGCDAARAPLRARAASHAVPRAASHAAPRADSAAAQPTPLAMALRGLCANCAIYLGKQQAVVAWRLHGGYTEVSWRLHGGCTAVTRRLYGGEMAVHTLVPRRFYCGSIAVACASCQPLRQVTLRDTASCTPAARSSIPRKVRPAALEMSHAFLCDPPHHSPPSK